MGWSFLVERWEHVFLPILCAEVPAKKSIRALLSKISSQNASRL